MLLALCALLFHAPPDWKQPPIQLMYRSIFIGSRAPLSLPGLADTVPTQQDATAPVPRP